MASVKHAKKAVESLTINIPFRLFSVFEASSNILPFMSQVKSDFHVISLRVTSPPFRHSFATHSSRPITTFASFKSSWVTPVWRGQWSILTVSLSEQ